MISMDSMTPVPGPLTSHLTTPPHSGHELAHTKGVHLGRERVPWHDEVWARIDEAVHFEFYRSCVAIKLLPIERVHPHALTAPAHIVLETINGQPLNVAAALRGANFQFLPNIDEGATVKLCEYWVEWSLTPAQVAEEHHYKHVEHEHHERAHVEHEHDEHARHEHAQHHRRHKHRGYSTAVALATRAARILALAIDAVVFLGQYATGNGQTGNSAIPQGPFFASNLVQNRGIPADFGLLGNGDPGQNPQYSLPPTQVVQVQSFPPLTNPDTVQILTVTGLPAASGTFTLAYTPSGASAVTLASGVSLTTLSLSTLQAAITAASAGATPVVSVTGGPVSSSVQAYSITFQGSSVSTATLITATTSGASAGVNATVGPPARYVENTVAAVALAYSILEGQGNYGPKAVVVYPYQFGDLNTPLATTLILPADRIKELMADGIHASGSLPGIPNPTSPPVVGALGSITTNQLAQAQGVVFCAGPDTVDLVVGHDPVSAFSTVDQFGNWTFRAVMRMTLRVKYPSALVRLEFQ
jgi:hypothetical protein